MSKAKQQIIAMGGGAFAQENNYAMDRYIMAQSRSRKPAVCFIPTATGDSREYTVRFYDTYSRLGCTPSHLELFTRTPDLRELLLRQDIIYVGGGNTRSMLAVWREWGLPRILREAWRSGTVLCGISAGAICWFDAGSTDSWANRLAPLKCLGFLPGGCCPHYDGEKERRPSVHRQVRNKSLPATLALDNGVAAHFVGRRLHRVVCDRDDASGFRVRVVRGEVQEEKLTTVRLTRTGRVS